MLQSMKEINTFFKVDTEHLLALGIVDPSSNQSLEIFESGKLTSNERLYFSLWGSKNLNSVAFDAKKKIFQKGDMITTAYFIVSGSLLSVDGDLIERLGPGSVLGLAEGISGIAYPKTVITTSPVEARALSLSKITHLIPRLPTVLQKILSNMVNRSLG
jgi:CRP-like cAMP-binding protein